MIAILSILIVFHLTFSFFETCLAYKFYYMKKERKKINGILNPDNTGIYINQTNRFGETEFSWRHIEIHASVLRSSVLKKNVQGPNQGRGKAPLRPNSKTCCVVPECCGLLARGRKRISSCHWIFKTPGENFCFKSILCPDSFFSSKEKKIMLNNTRVRLVEDETT